MKQLARHMVRLAPLILVIYLIMVAGQSFHHFCHCFEHSAITAKKKDGPNVFPAEIPEQALIFLPPVPVAVPSAAPDDQQVVAAPAAPSILSRAPPVSLS